MLRDKLAGVRAGKAEALPLKRTLPCRHRSQSFFTVEIPGYLERGAMVAELHFPPL